MRPRSLDEYIGQDHIVGKGRLLRRAIAADQLTSVIFYGPPGSGKTTLARVIANHTKSNFITLNAVLTGVADIRTAIKQAEDYYNLYSRRTILFVDEVHRWNRAQQDALLPWVENGTIILIGATTENPFFEVNKALVSRSRVFQLKPLTSNDLMKAAQQALTDAERGYGHWKIEFEKGALEHLIETANGDARSLLNALELAVETTPAQWNPEADPPAPAWGSTIYISREAAEESIQKKVILYDRDGDYHYDIISAFIKSLRGRDPDAAMYWLARMVAAGEDPHFIFRRMLISSCEDTGLADPNAITIVNNCAEAFDRVGMPEGRYFLAHAALYLATAPKSNSSMAFFDALASVEKEDTDVPNHLKDASRDSEGFGHGAGYLYPHAYRDHWVAQQYLPDSLMGRVFYTPSSQGYEKQIREEVLSRRELQIATILEKQQIQSEADTSADCITTGSKSTKNTVPFIKDKKQPTDTSSEFNVNPISEWWINEHFKGGETTKAEQLTFSPEDTSKETALDRADKMWKTRLDSNRTEILLSIRDTMISLSQLARHYRCLVWNADDGLLLWEIARRTPEGMTCGFCRTEQGKAVLEQYGRTLGNLDRPLLEYRPETARKDFMTPQNFVDVLAKFQYNGAVFDRVFFRDPFTSIESITMLADALAVVINGQKHRGKAFTDNYDEDDNSAASGLESPFAPGWSIVIAQRIPSNGQHIGTLIEKQILTPETVPPYENSLKKMEQAETIFFNDKTNPLFNWNTAIITGIFRKNGFSVKAASQILNEKRHITNNEIKRWFDTSSSAYGIKIAESIGTPELQKLVRLLEAAADTMTFSWQTEIAFFTISVPAVS